MSKNQEIKLQALTMISLKPLLQRLRTWWFSRLEEHYLICAEIERRHARQSEENEAYYQKLAATVRSELYWHS
jgi:hypothetical protein